MSDSPRGNFCWYELMSTDPAGSKNFYTQLMGWTVQPFDGAGDMEYDLWVNGEAPLGGLMQLPKEAKEQGAPTHWLPYVSTPDVDATAKQAQELGATVLMPGQDIPDAGRFSVLRDPQGGVFAVYHSAVETPTPEGTPGVGTFSWHELMTTDYEAAFGFYQKLFGWQVVDDMDMGPAGIYRLYGAGGPPLGGMFNKPPEVPVTAWMLYLRVADLDATIEQVKTLGGTILNGPMDVPGGDRIAQCMDPQGGAFALHVSNQST